MKFAINDRVKFKTHEGYVLSGKIGTVVDFHVNPNACVLICVRLDEPLNDANCTYIWNNYKYIEENEIAKED